MWCAPLRSAGGDDNKKGVLTPIEEDGEIGRYGGSFERATLNGQVLVTTPQLNARATARCSKSAAGLRPLFLGFRVQDSQEFKTSL